MNIVKIKKTIGISVFALSSIAATAIIPTTSVAAPSNGGTTTKKVCKMKDIPTIICPAGETLATEGNSCTVGFVKKKVCRKASGRLSGGLMTKRLARPPVYGQKAR